MAVALAGAGARIGIHGTKADKLEETRQAIEEVGGDGVVLSASLGDASQCQKLAVDAQSALGRIDILLNCAGTSRRKLIDTVTQEEFDWIIGVNLRSAFFLSQTVHPMMREQGGGKIINIGSMTSTLGFANLSVYGMTKSALAQATKTMAISGRPTTSKSTVWHPVSCIRR
jgi:NAD(P)-dependent dehydrogenase (short-subunit alcohol dehydrogenase family)